MFWHSNNTTDTYLLNSITLISINGVGVMKTSQKRKNVKNIFPIFPKKFLRVCKQTLHLWTLTYIYIKKRFKEQSNKKKKKGETIINLHYTVNVHVKKLDCF